MPVPEGQNEDRPPHWKGETGVFLGGALTVLLVTVYAPGMPHVLDLGALIGAVLGGVLVMTAYRRWRRRRAGRG
ncbi:hypothetical protein ACP4TB_27460 [Streptomyces sp. DR3-1]|uniref:hypothetical protein n=1 Tax=Streptomyces sp. DR3-1 TaxID=2951169 RepID=UPI00255B3AFE|nr:hypothetical protein [Streptomyces sp. DR3-1]